MKLLHPCLAIDLAHYSACESAHTHTYIHEQRNALPLKFVDEVFLAEGQA